jgi:hypothetical protein
MREGSKKLSLQRCATPGRLMEQNGGSIRGWLVLIALGVLLLTACSVSSPQSQPQAPDYWSDLLSFLNPASQQAQAREWTYPIDPLFAEFYQTLGGEAVLGPVISPVSISENRYHQYVESGLLVFDQQAAGSNRFSLAPLGKEFGVLEAPVSRTGNSQGRYVNGHYILDEFLPTYDQLGGARFVGQPLTEPHHNLEKQRIEQYFENLGFYRMDQDLPGTVRLMAYGVYACDHRCRYQAPSAGIPSLQPVLPEQFRLQVARLGESFSGAALTESYLNPDGKQEVIFENLVLVADESQPGGATPRPIVEETGFPAQPLMRERPDPLMVFFPIEGNKGHHIPIYFYTYILEHGGFAFSGEPISEVFLHEQGVYRQCFTNLCLEYDLSLPGTGLRLAPLGLDYKEKVFDKAWDFTRSQSLEGTSLKIWEENPFVTSEEEQTIHVAVLEGNKPLTNREPYLEYTLPDGSQQKVYFPPTGSDGLASADLPAIDAPNGTLIAYQVCLNGILGENLCVGDNYLIWNYQ